MPVRIDFLQVSNVLSFKYTANISNAEKIAFEDGLNIIIGENGSGKSTALEVLNFIFRRVFYRQFNINRELLERRNAITVTERRQILRWINQPDFGPFRLAPNWNSEDKEQRIRIAIKLDDIDRENIKNIREKTLQK